MQVHPIELKNIKIISDLTQEIQNRQIQIENCRKEGTKVMNLFEEKRSLIFKLKSDLEVLNHKIAKLRENVVEDPEETLKKKKHAEDALKIASEEHGSHKNILDKNEKYFRLLDSKNQVFSTFLSNLKELLSVARETKE